MHERERERERDAVALLNGAPPPTPIRPSRPGFMDLGRFKAALSKKGGEPSSTRHAARMRGEELASDRRPSGTGCDPAAVGATNALRRRRWSLAELVAQLKERIQMKSKGGGRYQDAFRLFYGTQIGNELTKRAVMTKEQLHRSLQVR